MAHFWLLVALSDRMASVQSLLNFEGWGGYRQFEDKMVRLTEAQSNSIASACHFFLLAFL